MPLDPFDVVDVEVGDRHVRSWIGEHDLPGESAGRAAEVEHMGERSLRQQALDHLQVFRTAEPVGQVAIVVISFAVDRRGHLHPVALDRVNRFRLQQVFLQRLIDACYLVQVAIQLGSCTDCRCELAT